MKAANGLYMIGGRTAVVITRSSDEHRGVAFDQRRIGLHQLCFRARSREDIDALHRFLVAEGVKVVHPPADGPWSLFADLSQVPLTRFPGYEHYPE